MPGCFALSMPTLPATPTTERELGYAVGSVAAATKNIQREDAQLSLVRHPGCCYQLLARLEEREACSWLRHTSAGIKKALRREQKEYRRFPGNKAKNPS